MKLDTDKSDEEIVQQAKMNGIKISCLSQYCFKQDKIENSMVILIIPESIRSM